MTHHAIVSIVSDAKGVSVKDMMSDSREWPIVLARWKAMWLCREHLSASYSQIGRWFNKDHGTVLHGLSKLKNLPESFVDDLPRLSAAVSSQTPKLKFSDLIGARVLISDMRGTTITEASVDCLSPGGQYVKLVINGDTQGSWFPIEKYRVADVLKTPPQPTK